MTDSDALDPEATDAEADAQTAEELRVAVESTDNINSLPSPPWGVGTDKG